MMRLLRTSFALVCLFAAEAAAAPRLTFSCSAENDLYRALVSDGLRPPRFEMPVKAVEHAPPGSGVLILSDGYPSQRMRIDPHVLQLAREKKLRLLIEYPQALPGLEFTEPRTATWERVVVTSDWMSQRNDENLPNIPEMRILSAHACYFTPIRNADVEPLLTLARVAGFDRAVYGLPSEHFPVLFRTSDGHLVATTQLSNFVTARYAPSAHWVNVWKHLLAQLDPDGQPHEIMAEPVARPSYGKSDELPLDAERQAVARFANWIDRSGLLIPPQRNDALRKLIASGIEITDPPAPGEPAGNGSLGLLEGFASQIRFDGHQMRRTPLRADCHAESAMVLALHASLSGEERSRTVAKNLLDFVYFNSGMHGGARGDPKHPAFGLIAWGIGSPAWEVANYGDDNARTILGTIAAAAYLHTDTWDAAMLKALLANLRTTGQFGFRGDRIDIPQLEQNGWRHYRDAKTINYALNFEAYLWACYLWAYHQTGERDFLDRTKIAIRMTMDAYPRQWRWADNMERARMLLPLAWLVRVEDTPEHRAWIDRIAGDLLEMQDECGAIREHLGGTGGGAGHYVVPATNEAYGTTETPLIQTNGDPVADQLYTTGFALLGLHECAAATGDAKLRESADKLAAFLVRIQVRSTKLPYLDGAWFRAFDYGLWDYWASSADVGWGAWSAEAGWCPAWTAATLALRVKGTSLWELTSKSNIERHLDRVRPLMN